MELSSLIRRTVDRDPVAQPSAQIFIDGQGKVWHDLNFTFQTLAKNGLSRNKQQWRIDARKYWARETVPDSCYHLRRHDDPASFRSNICTTFGLYILLWSHFVYGRACEQLRCFIDALVIAVPLYIHKMLLSTPCASAGVQLSPHFQNIGVVENGRAIIGIGRALEQLIPKHRNVIIDAWSWLAEQNKVSDNLDAPAQLISDVFRFLFYAPSYFVLKRQAQAP
jgi:hypothetical protein